MKLMTPRVQEYIYVSAPPPSGALKSCRLGNLPWLLPYNGQSAAAADLRPYAVGGSVFRCRIVRAEPAPS